MHYPRTYVRKIGERDLSLARVGQSRPLPLCSHPETSCLTERAVTGATLPLYNRMREKTEFLVQAYQNRTFPWNDGRRS
nr:MAG TPA: hypothetical protein [Caudoviricetes sp.]